MKAFRDYFKYEEDIEKIPPHRVLAINRAERGEGPPREDRLQYRGHAWGAR